MEDAPEVGAEGTDIVAPDESVDFDSVVADDLSTEGEVEDGVVDSEAAADETTVDDSDRYTIKVDGEEIEVTLDELLNGYSRQSDYTRKTQEIAQERQRLQTLAQFEQALNQNPEAAIRALAEAYNLGGQVGNQSLEDLDPLEAKVQLLERQLAQQQEQARVAQITTEASQAIAAAKLDVAPNELIQFAYENQIGNLAVAAKFMAAEGRTNARKVEVVRKTQGKRSAAVVSGGANRTASTTKAPPVNSIHDAFAQAIAELG